MKALILLLTFVFYSFSYSGNCKKLIDQIDQVHSHQMSMEASNGQSMREIISARKQIHSAYQIAEDKDKKANLKKHLVRHDSAINDIMLDNNFARMSRINKYLSSEFIKSCSDSNVVSTESKLNITNIRCFNSGYRFGSFPEANELGSDVMSAISFYMIDAEKEKSFSLNKVSRDCKKLVKKDIKLDGCLTILPQLAENKRDVAEISESLDEGNKKASWCPKGQEYSNGTCRKKCNEFEYRTPKNPDKCTIDVDAQKAANMRKQRSKEKWGKVLRTGATVALIGGAGVLAAWGIKEIFNIGENKNNSSSNSLSKPRRNFYYPSSQAYQSYYPSQQYGMGYNGQPAWRGFNPYYNYNSAGSASDFSNYSFEF